MFATGDPTLASIGRFLQGAGGVFALIGAAYHRHHPLPGLARGDADRGDPDVRHGGRLGRPVRSSALPSRAGCQWNQFWIVMGFVGLAIAGLLLAFIPRREAAPRPPDPRARAAGRRRRRSRWGRVPQSAVDSLRPDRRPDVHPDDDLRHGLGRALPAGRPRHALLAWRCCARPRSRSAGSSAVRCWACSPTGSAGASPSSSAARPSCSSASPSSSTARRACSRPSVSASSPGSPPGAAMIPYTVIKEANRPEHSGTATGVVNFINFSFSALLGPVFGGLLMRASGGGERELGHYQAAFQPLLYGVGLAIVLTLFLRETGQRGPTGRRPRDLTIDGRPDRRRTRPASIWRTRWQDQVARSARPPATNAASRRSSARVSGRRRSTSATSSSRTSRPITATRRSSRARPSEPRRSGQSCRPCSSRSARRACSTSRRSRARSPRTTPAISTRTTRSSSACRPTRR